MNQALERRPSSSTRTRTATVGSSSIEMDATRRGRGAPRRGRLPLASSRSSASQSPRSPGSLNAQGAGTLRQAIVRGCGHDNQAGATSARRAERRWPSEDETTATPRFAIEDRRGARRRAGGVLDELAGGLGRAGRPARARTPGAASARRDTTTVGRHPDSDIFLDDITVSRRHADDRPRTDGYEVSDAGSLNGTYVDHERIETARCGTATSCRSAGSCSRSGARRPRGDDVA